MTKTTKIGELGEQMVGKWLESQGWLILDHRWRCRWGEIDLIAQDESSQTLVFVEVKTRSRGNWDADGILAITPQKQAKLWSTAELFLAEYPDFATLPCRFDVALVSYKKIKPTLSAQLSYNCCKQIIKIGEPIFWEGYQFTLQNYIESAFDAV
ncbi:MAG: YraN family protein [Moorea sp. SIO2B7]|nr:YraN family protein [Moorena sp. SIO2B7]